jgi:hypothetical protein
MHDRESGKFPLREFACSVFYRLLVPKGGAKSIRQGEKSGSCLRLRPKRCADKLAPAFLNGGTVAVPFSRFFTMRIRRALRAKRFSILRKMSAASFGHSLCRSVKKTYI